jgi:cyclase
MLLTRVMPCLLLQDGSLVKTVQFKDAGYIGDPINAIRIYNQKEVDELVFLDISATPEGRKPPFKVLSEIASECLMPVAYGGGVRDLGDIKEIFSLGIEKVAVNSYAFENPRFVRDAAERFGSQSIVVSIDVKKTMSGRYEVYIRGGRQATGLDPVKFAVQMAEQGAGELLLTSIDRDGTMTGYDLKLLQALTSAVDVPVIACGGAGSIADFAAAIQEGGASACAAGSMFVYFGRNRAVLINFPTQQELRAVLGPLEPRA